MEDSRLDDRKRLLKRIFTFIFEFPIFSIISRPHQKERGIQYQSQEKEETGAYLVKKKES